MSKEVRMARLPDCDICRTEGTRGKASFDGKTRMGPWAYMCERHFTEHGVGLGLGRGQKLVLMNADEAEAAGYDSTGRDGHLD